MVGLLGLFFPQGLLMISSNLRALVRASAATWMCWRAKHSPVPGRSMPTSHCECEELCHAGRRGSVLTTDTLSGGLLCSGNTLLYFDFANDHQ